MGAVAFKRLLVANRGEVARRIIRAARAVGIETVAVYTPDDRHSPFVTEADVAVDLTSRLERPPRRDLAPLDAKRGGYLDIDAIIDALRRSGADAVHPGYGFLSEDPRLALACEDAGAIWVGPPAAAIDAMGHKANAKETVAAAGVPVLNSVVLEEKDGAIDGVTDGVTAAGERVGYPLLVKASAGGGGRGMRLVESPAELPDAVESARHEAAAAFGSGELFLERFLRDPRHIEVQIAADCDQDVVHLFDRECSLQRRHQKVIEEAPASNIARVVRESMSNAAITCAKTVGYEGIGTVEFLVEGDEFYFLEMNTRLQVEHCVTEMVTGVDLVELQFLLASGSPLPFSQDEISAVGHAVEARLCAERPREEFRPTPGTVLHAKWPSGPSVRVDAAVESGSTVSPTYDNLVAKIVAHGRTRSQAVSSLSRAIARDLELDGVETNRELLVAALCEPDFKRGDISTRYFDVHPAVVNAGLDVSVRERHAAAAALFLEDRRSNASLVPSVPKSFRNVGSAVHVDRFTCDGEHWHVTLKRSRDSLTAHISGPNIRDLDDSISVDVSALVRAHDPGDVPGDAPGDVPALATSRGSSGAVELCIGGVLEVFRVRAYGAQIFVNSHDGQSSFEIVGIDDDSVVGDAGRECRAPLPGAVTKVVAEVGQRVEEGTPLIVMEAMKMEHTLRATGPGTLTAVFAVPGSQVDAGDLLALVDGLSDE